MGWSRCKILKPRVGCTQRSARCPYPIRQRGVVLMPQKGSQWLCNHCAAPQKRRHGRHTGVRGQRGASRPAACAAQAWHPRQRQPAGRPSCCTHPPWQPPHRLPRPQRAAHAPPSRWRHGTRRQRCRCAAAGRPACGAASGCHCCAGGGRTRTQQLPQPAAATPAAPAGSSAAGAVCTPMLTRKGRRCCCCCCCCCCWPVAGAPSASGGGTSVSWPAAAAGAGSSPTNRARSSASDQPSKALPPSKRRSLHAKSATEPSELYPLAGPAAPRPAAGPAAGPSPAAPPAPALGMVWWVPGRPPEAAILERKLVMPGDEARLDGAAGGREGRSSLGTGQPAGTEQVADQAWLQNENFAPDHDWPCT